MHFENPVLEIAFPLEEVTKLIEGLLKKKNWHSFEVAETKLALSPFYIFYYDAGFAEEGKGKVVEKTERGRLALDALSGKLNEALAASLPDESKFVKELPDNYPVEEKKPIFSKKEAEKIALLKTASLLHTAREHVIISGFKMLYYPMWLVYVTVAEGNYELEVSAVSGEIFGEEQVPEREKGFAEITRETLDELREPGTWLRYSREIGGIVVEKIGKKGSGEAVEASARGEAKLPALLHNPSFWISLALIVILIAVTFFM